jgi:hypothetical protein
MEQKASSFDFKTLFLNTVIVLLCAAPKFGWACFLLLTGVYTVAAFRYSGMRSKFITNLVVIAAAVFAYFSAYRFNQSTHDMPDYFLGVALIQFAVVLALVIYFQFTIYKPKKEFIKAGV